MCPIATDQQSTTLKEKGAIVRHIEDEYDGYVTHWTPKYLFCTL